ncbi:MAG: isopentenyl phosphate kinase [Anaerolineae bacterium]
MMLFLKLGGSLITDKTGVEIVRPDVLARLAAEIAAARTDRPDLRLLVGHGGGSFGHVAAAKYDTRRGVKTAVQWRGFAEVHAAMARLNRLVVEALLAAGVPALSLQPSALAWCGPTASVRNGRITTINAAPIQAALDVGLVPVIYGDVAFDAGQGGTIISTEEIMAALVEALRPSWLLLAGVTEGVLDQSGRLIPTITPANLPQIEAALGGSHGTDVTGGMASKVRGMLALTAQYPALQVRIFSGLTAGNVKQVVMASETAVGTRIAQA